VCCRRLHEGRKDFWASWAVEEIQTERREHLSGSLTFSRWPFSVTPDPHSIWSSSPHCADVEGAVTSVNCQPHVMKLAAGHRPSSSFDHAFEVCPLTTAPGEHVELALGRWLSAKPTDRLGRVVVVHRQSPDSRQLRQHLTLPTRNNSSSLMETSGYSGLCTRCTRLVSSSPSAAS